MVVDLSDLFEVPGAIKKFKFEIPQEILKEIKGVSFSNLAEIDGVLFNKTGVLYLEYSALFTLNCVCDRCLREFERKFSFDVDRIVVRKDQDGDFDVYDERYAVVDGLKLDLQETALSDLVLNCPIKILCDENCKGLCMHCGKDLNEGQCSCIHSNV